MSDIIEERDIDSKNTYIKSSEDSSLNLKYMEEKAVSSLYSSKYLNDDEDNKINDHNNNEKIMIIIGSIIELCNRETSGLNKYDIGYNIGILSERLPNYFYDELNSIRKYIQQNDLVKVKNKIDNIKNIIIK